MIVSLISITIIIIAIIIIVSNSSIIIIVSIISNTYNLLYTQQKVSIHPQKTPYTKHTYVHRLSAKRTKPKVSQPYVGTWTITL